MVAWRILPGRHWLLSQLNGTEARERFDLPDEPGETCHRQSGALRLRRQHFGAERWTVPLFRQNGLNFAGDRGQCACRCRCLLDRVIELL